MPNKNYLRSRTRETEIRNQLEKDGWYAIRAAGSHGVADVVAIKTTPCGIPEHFITRFIQVKVSIHQKKFEIIPEAIETPFGYVNVEFWHYPVKTKEWFADKKKRDIKQSSRKLKKDLKKV